MWHISYSTSSHKSKTMRQNKLAPILHTSHVYIELFEYHAGLHNIFYASYVKKNHCREAMQGFKNFTSQD